jgi:hypothetical protein
VLVYDAALLGAHRVELNALAVAKRLLGGPIGARGQRFAAPLPVAGRVDDNPLALPHSAKSGLVGKQLQCIDRLPPFPDQQSVVVIATDGSGDPVVLLANLNLATEVKLIENALNNLPNPLSRLPWPVVSSSHAVQSMRDRLEAASGCELSPFSSGPE